MGARRLRAAWLLSLSRPPVPDGAVLIGEDGRIRTCGAHTQVPAPPGVPEDHFPAAILLPGLVNAHTHLELTGMAGRAEEDAFPDWIRRIRRLKQERTATEFLDAARTGLRACWAGGVTTVADTGDTGAALSALAEAGGSGTVYHEVFGPHPAQAAAAARGLELRLSELAALAGPRLRLGVSPHAPYSVSGPLYRATTALAERDALPLAVHVAESVAETALIAESRGPFAEAWQGRGIPLPDDLAHLAEPLAVRTPVRWLDAHGVLGPDTLCIHVVHAERADLTLLARRGASVVHCPRSNARHRHGEAPLGAMLAAGLRVGIGTDSEASVPSPDLFAEAREARRIAGLDAATTLRLLTLDGALAIGMGDVGLLEAGAWGDACLLEAGEGSGLSDPVEQVLAAGPAGVLATYVGGRPVYRRGGEP